MESGTQLSICAKGPGTLLGCSLPPLSCFRFNLDSLLLLLQLTDLGLENTHDFSMSSLNSLPILLLLGVLRLDLIDIGIHFIIYVLSLIQSLQC